MSRPPKVLSSRAAALMVAIMLFGMSTAPVSAQANIVPFFMPTPEVDNTVSSDVQSDRAGGLHIAFSSFSGVDSDFPVYYGYCAGHCGVVQNWRVSIVGRRGFFGGYVRLALDPSGRPRMMWSYQKNAGDLGEYRYAECDAQCTNPASWRIVGVATTGDYAPYSEFFALDPVGRPRFVYNSDISAEAQATYAFCNTNCTVAANWTRTPLNIGRLRTPQLRFTSAGQPRLMFVTEDLFVRYSVCDTNCSAAGSWSSGTLLPLGNSTGDFKLRLDSLSRPRLALYDGQKQQLSYYWCNANCIGVAGWTGAPVGLPAKYGVDVDLALDEQHRPRLAYYIDTYPYALGYAACAANCESAAASWKALIVETSNQLDQRAPVLLIPGCSLQAWYPGQHPSLALDPQGRPFIGYDARHLQGGSCSVRTDIQIVRFVAPLGDQSAIYLPLMRR